MNASGTETIKIISGGDDGWTWNTESFDSAGNTLTVGNKETGGPIPAQLSANAFLLFESVNIPRGSTITAATITMTSDSNLAGTTVTLKIHCNDADNATAPTNEAEHDGKARTMAFASWSPGGWTSDTEYTTPDIASAVQEVISRNGWNRGNNLLVLIDDDGSNDDKYREIKSYDQTSVNCAEITITYKKFVPSVIVIT